jgi:uncharacterized protein YfiM (DUF2279 family)
MSYPDTVDKKMLKTVIGVESAVYIAGISYLNYIWYKDHERTPFHFYNDSKGHLLMDKAGHAFSAYYESLFGYHALRRAGVKKKKALVFGGPLGIVLQTPIEILDGMYEGWGFSWPDMAANALGSLLFITQQAIWDDQIVKMKFSYSPSIYPSYHTDLGTNHLNSFFLDYNAHTYWFSANMKRITGIEHIPDWLNLAIGYSANGMIGKLENPTVYRGQPFPYLERYRQLLFSLDINFAKIPTKKIWLRNFYRALNIIKIPFPTLEYNRIEGVKFRPLYF